jgi:glycolate oxidase FAD binding subunit
LPIPLASTTLVATYADGNALAHDVAVLNGSQVELAAFDLSVSGEGRWILLMRMASSPAATAAQAAEARRLLSSVPAAVSGDEERSLWDEQIRAPWEEGGTIVRFSWLPSKLPAVVALLSRLHQNGCHVTTLTARAIGSGLIRLEGEESAIASAVTALRASQDVGHVVVLRATPGVKARLDVWGPASGTIEVARTLKRMFDPADILNAGRGPV